MVDDQQEGPNPPPRRLPRVSDLFDVTDDMIAFADKYQKVWEHEAKATIALGQFLNERASSLGDQVDLMRMGSDSFRRYSAWSQAVFGVRPETFMQGVLDQMERFRGSGPRRRTRGPGG